MHLYLVVGASRGFGLALWKTLHGVADNEVVIYSRSPVVTPDDRVTHFAMDLANMNSITSVFTDSLSKYATKEYANVTLVTNAAVLGELVAVRNLKDYASVASAINTNLTSRIALSSIFLNHFPNAKKTIVDISSGAHRAGSETWSIYCSTKAAGVILHQSIAKEEPDVRVLSYSPGIMDTKMQKEIADDAADSPSKNFLKAIIAAGKAVPVEESVQELLRVLTEDKYESGAYVDIYDTRGPPTLD